MKLHELGSPKGSRKRKKIVGRGPGSGHGQTSCRGEKGQRSRAGRWSVKGSEGGQMPLIRRLPKVGFHSHRPIIYQVVNLESLRQFKSETVVTAELLKSKGIISSLNKPVKVLGNGDIKNSLVVKVDSISQSAHDKITKAGGKFEAAVKQEKQEEKKALPPKKK